MSAGPAAAPRAGKAQAEPAGLDDELGIKWSDPRFPPHQLHGINVLHYFCQPGDNPFYDRSSNNERVKQMNHQLLDLERLSAMKGKEYAVVHSQPPVLHIIQERTRLSSTSVVPRAEYYVVQGEVYKCPDLGTLLHSKLASALHHLQISLDKAAELKRFRPAEGYAWADEAEAADAGGAAKRVEPAPDRRLHSRVAQLISNVPVDFAPPESAKRRGDAAVDPRAAKKAK